MHLYICTASQLHLQFNNFWQHISCPGHKVAACLVQVRFNNQDNICDGTDPLGKIATKNELCLFLKIILIILILYTGAFILVAICLSEEVSKL